MPGFESVRIFRPTFRGQGRDRRRSDGGCERSPPISFAFQPEKHNRDVKIICSRLTEIENSF